MQQAPSATQASGPEDESPAIPEIASLVEPMVETVRNTVGFQRLLIFQFTGDEEEERLFYDCEQPPILPSDSAPSPLHSGLTVPVRFGEVLVGRLVIFSESEDAYSSSDLESLEEIALSLGPILSEPDRDEKAVADELALNVEIAELRDLVDDLRTANGELAEAVEELEWRNSQIQSSRARLVEAHESAKRAVAEELHGAVQTRLYAAWVRLQELEQTLADNNPDAASVVSLVGAELDEIREQDIRLLSHRLHPSVIRLGLGSALRSLRDTFGGVLEIDLQISEEFAALEPAGQSALPKNLRLGLYRVAELAVGNVLKHAGTGSCIVELVMLEPRVVSMRITDNGFGFPEDSRVPQGIGLATMDDYADSLGGSLTVTSLPGKGTSIEVIVPISRLAEEDEFAAEPQAIGTMVDIHWAEPQHNTAN